MDAISCLGKPGFDREASARLLEMIVFAEGPQSKLLQEVAKSAQSRWLRNEAQTLLACA